MIFLVIVYAGLVFGEKCETKNKYDNLGLVSSESECVSVDITKLEQGVRVTKTCAGTDRCRSAVVCVNTTYTLGTTENQEQETGKIYEYGS